MAGWSTKGTFSSWNETLKSVLIFTVACSVVAISAGWPQSQTDNRISIKAVLKACERSVAADQAYKKWKDCLQKKVNIFTGAKGNVPPTAEELAAVIVELWHDTIGLHRLKSALTDITLNGKPAYEKKDVVQAVRAHGNIPFGCGNDRLRDILETLKEVYAFSPDKDPGKWIEQIKKAFAEREHPPGAVDMANTIMDTWKSTISQKSLHDALAGLTDNRGHPAYSSGDIARTVAMYFGLTQGAFNTQVVRDWKTPNLKSDFKRFTFGPFHDRPLTPVGLQSIDLDKGGKIHVECHADNVSRQGLEIHVSSSGRLYSGGCHWMAIAPTGRDIQAGNVQWKEGDKSERWISFPQPFSSKPQVAVCLNELFMSNGRNWRIKTETANINEKGFTLIIDKWADTILWKAGVTWIAFTRKGMTSGRFNTMEVRPWNRPQSKDKVDKKGIVFPPGTFSATPKVFVGLNWMDIARSRNLRIGAEAVNVNKAGMTLRIWSWADTHMYTAGLSYIAFQ